MTHPAWFLIAVGLPLVGAGVVGIIAPAIPGLRRLPGGAAIDRETFRFYLPLTTCTVASVLLSAIVWLARYFSR